MHTAPAELVTEEKDEEVLAQKLAFLNLFTISPSAERDMIIIMMKRERDGKIVDEVKFTIDVWKGDVHIWEYWHEPDDLDWPIIFSPRLEWAIQKLSDRIKELAAIHTMVADFSFICRWINECVIPPTFLVLNSSMTGED